eukprot:gene10402-2931_t
MKEVQGILDKVRSNKIGGIIMKYFEDWRNDLFFYAQKPVAVTTSIAYFWRFFAILWMITIYIYYIGSYKTEIPVYLIYLTNQTFTLTFIYFIISFLCSSYTALQMMHMISELPEKDERKWFPKHPEILYYVLRFFQGRLYPLCILSNILVPPLYWILVYHGQIPGYYTVGAHGISAILYLLDAIFEMIHISWLDFLFVLVYAPIYVGIVFIYHGISGIWAYSALDTTKNPYAAVVYVGCFAFYYIGFFVLVFMSFGKLLLVGFLKKKFQSFIWISKEKTEAPVSNNLDEQELQNIALTSEESLESTSQQEQGQTCQQEKLDEVELGN